MNLSVPVDFSVRPYEPALDIPSLLAVHAACAETDRIDPYSVCYRLPNLSAEQYAKEVATMKLCIVATVSDDVIAHGFMEVWGEEDRAYLWRVWVKPAWRNKGVGTALLHWGEAKARELHGGDLRPALLLANASEGEQDAVQLLQNEGYRLRFVSPELAFDDFANLPVPREISGIAIRSIRPDEKRAVASALCEANLDSPGNEERWQDDELQTRIDNHIGEWLTRVSESDPALSFAAWDGEHVAGAYLCNRNGAVGEIAQVAVRAAWRGRGIARLLAQHSLQALYRAGCVTARLFTSIGADEVEPTHGPYAMYRKFGFYPIARHLRFFKPLTDQAR